MYPCAMNHWLPLCGWAIVALLVLSCTDDPGRIVVVGGPGQTSGTGGIGGAGGSEPALACEPGSSQTCYSGPPDTLDVGACKAGVATCAPDGSAYGPCTGEVIPNFEDCGTVEDDDCNGSAACEMVDWVKPFGGPKDQIIRKLLVAPDGSIFMGGSFGGSVSFGGDTFSSHSYWDQDAFVAKLSPSGEHVWSRPLWSNSNELVENIALDSTGRLYVAGYFSTEINLDGLVLSGNPQLHLFFAQFDPDGHAVRATALGDSGWFNSSSLAVTRDDGVLLLITGTGTVDFGGGPLTNAGYNTEDVYLAKFDSSGQHVWSKRFGDSYRQSGRRVVVDAAGNIFIVGSFSGVIDFGGGPLTASAPLDRRDGFIAKFDAAGNHLRSKSFGGPGNEHIQDIAFDSAGNVVIIGTYDQSFDFGGGPLPHQGGYDIFLAKLDSLGNPIFSAGFGDGADQVSWALAMDDGGRIAMTFNHNAGGDGFSFDGVHTLRSVDSQDGFVSFFADSGAYQGAFPIAGPQGKWVGPIAFDKSGSLIVGGVFEGTADFGGHTSLTSVDRSDVFLAKLRP